MKVLLIIKDKNKEALEVSLRIKENLKEFGIDYFEYFLSSEEDKFSGYDLAITLGGDGTIIRACKMVKVPILGINVGGRGILAEIKPKDFSEALKRIVKGEFFVEKRMMLEVDVKGKIYPPVLNEVLFIKAEPLYTPLFKVTLPLGDEISSKMDGLMVSTPTGSTGHSYSLGGPIAQEDLELFIVNFIAPLNRLPPLILPPNPITLSSTHPSFLVLDGQNYEKLESEERVKVKKSNSYAEFLRLDKKSLRQIRKLGF
ncbi:NAD kinase [archaeon HR06]|nr:NAD kinase [archaeon HR06]